MVRATKLRAGTPKLAKIEGRKDDDVDSYFPNLVATSRAAATRAPQAAPPPATPAEPAAPTK